MIISINMKCKCEVQYFKVRVTFLLLMATPKKGLLPYC